MGGNEIKEKCLCDICYGCSNEGSPTDGKWKCKNFSGSDWVMTKLFEAEEKYCKILSIINDKE